MDVRDLIYSLPENSRLRLLIEAAVRGDEAMVEEMYLPIFDNHALLFMLIEDLRFLGQNFIKWRVDFLESEGKSHDFLFL
jgi:hypothetical protein